MVCCANSGRLPAEAGTPNHGPNARPTGRFGVPASAGPCLLHFVDSCGRGRPCDARRRACDRLTEAHPTVDGRHREGEQVGRRRRRLGLDAEVQQRPHRPVPRPPSRPPHRPAAAHADADGVDRVKVAYPPALTIGTVVALAWLAMQIGRLTAATLERPKNTATSALAVPTFPKNGLTLPRQVTAFPGNELT